MGLNPFLIFNSKSNLDRLVDRGHVGWGLFGFADEGPKVLNISKRMLDRFGIDETEILALSVSLMTVSGLNQSFDEITFTVPFPTSREGVDPSEKEDLFILCTTFIHLDPTIKDNRMDNKLLAVYSIFLPKFFMMMLGNMNKVTSIVKEFVDQTNNIQEFNQTENLCKITKKVLNVLL